MFWFAMVACRPPKAPEPETPVVLPIAALNDFHGALYETTGKDPTKALGGLPWLHAALESLRSEHPDLLVLDGGDLFQGSWPVNASRGMGSVEAYNLLGVDAAAVGNHEFDYGGIDGGHPLRGAFERAASAADFAWLSANVVEAGKRWQPPGVSAWTLLERDGVRIGVIGLTTTDTPQTTLAKNVADLEFRDVVTTVRELLPELDAAEVDVVAVVGHLTGACEPPGYADPPTAECRPDGEIGRLLTELAPGTIDVMVVGHAHTLLANRIGDTFVLESRSNGHVIGRLDLVVGPNGVDPDASVLHPPWLLSHEAVDPGCEDRPFPMDARDVGGRVLEPSRKALELVDRLEAESGSLCDEVGCSAEPLGRSRTSESAAGNLVADALLAAFPGADLAVQNSGGLRADLPSGTLRREHLQAVMPFENRVLLVEMTGEQVLRMFAIGSSGAHGILQIAGASYSFDPAIETGTDQDGDGAVAEWERQRLCRVTVGGTDLDPSRKYKVVTSDFLYAGGDHLGPAFAGTTILDQGPLLREALEGHVRAATGCVGSTPLVNADAPRVSTCKTPGSGG